jgi:hypothetical protein
MTCSKISQISRGKVTLRPQALDLREVVGKAVEMASPLLEQAASPTAPKCLPDV